MSRYSKETIAAKFEWEGDDALEWFEPSEVPFIAEDLWRRAWSARSSYEEVMHEIHEWLESDG
jgi:hypothetical protein